MNEFEQELESAEDNIHETLNEISRLKESFQERRELIENSDELKQNALFKKLDVVEKRVLLLDEKLLSIQTSLKKTIQISQNSKLSRNTIIAFLAIILIVVVSISARI